MTQAYSFTADPTPVTVAFAPPAPQSRASIFLRIVMAIPAAIFTGLVGIAAFFAVIVAWFAALFTGQVPEGLHRFLHGYLGLYTRLQGYIWMLTGVYPPFQLHAPDYPIAVSVMRSKHRRLTVLVRIILAIPAALLATIVNTGVTVVSPAIWLIVLIKGRMPDTVFMAVASVLRYQTRLGAYTSLLTAAYPGDLFGDPPTFAPPAAAGGMYAPIPVPNPPSGSPLPPPPPMSPSGAPGPWSPPGTSPTTGFPPTSPPPFAPQGAPTNVAGSMLPPPPAATPAGLYSNVVPEALVNGRLTRLVLAKGAKRLLVAFIVLGVIGGITNAAITSSASARAVSVSQINRHYRTLEKAANDFQDETAACTAKADFVCAQRADVKLAQAFTEFGDQLDAVAVPARAQLAADTVLADVRRIAILLNDLGKAPTATAYQQRVPELQSRLRQFDTDYKKFADVI
ncbi:MAG: DUF4389 domain-containing protein [Acidimicrobiia bacterium]